MVNQTKWSQKAFTAEARNAAGLDSCCSKAIMGIAWFKSYKMDIPDGLRDMIKGPYESGVSFIFGGGQSKGSLGRYIIPLQLHGYNCKMDVELVEANIPLLISIPAMGRAGIILDFSENKTTVFGVTRNMERTTTGYPIIRVLPTGGAANRGFLDLVINEAPETVDEEADQGEISWEEQKKIIHRVHQQLGHPGKFKLFKFLTQSTIIWDDMKMKQELEVIAANCRACDVRREVPFKPETVIPDENSFNYTVGIGLELWGKVKHQTIVLYVTDIWSGLIQAWIVGSKDTEEVIERILNGWVAKYGAYRAVLADNGEQFHGCPWKKLVRGGWWEKMVELLGCEDLTTTAKSLPLYSMIQRVRDATSNIFETLKTNFPKYDRQTLLQWATMTENSKIPVRGWSPFQIVHSQNPKMPSLMVTCTKYLRPVNMSQPQLEEMTVTRILDEQADILDQVRAEYQASTAGGQIREILKNKSRNIRRITITFRRGDEVYWKATDHPKQWRQGKVAATDGPLLFIKQDDSTFVRVHTDTVIRKNENRDEDGRLITPEKIRKTRARASQDLQQPGASSRGSTSSSTQTTPPATLKRRRQQGDQSTTQSQTHDTPAGVPRSSSGSEWSHPQVSKNSDTLTNANSSHSEEPPDLLPAAVETSEELSEMPPLIRKSKPQLKQPPRQ